jgi:phosphopantothenoylcysteine synthetase/decarboxylase
MPAVTLVVCAAPLARRVSDIATSLLRDGWSVSVVGTPAAAAWFDADELTAAVGSSPRFDYRQPGEPKSTVKPDVIAVCPATFNTVNKVAAGIADNYAVGLICEAVGSGPPLLIAPMVNRKLWSHFAWTDAHSALRKTGVQFLDVQSGQAELTAIESGTGESVAEAFRPEWLELALREILGTTT